MENEAIILIIAIFGSNVPVYIALFSINRTLGTQREKLSVLEKIVKDFRLVRDCLIKAGVLQISGED